MAPSVLLGLPGPWAKDDRLAPLGGSPATASAALRALPWATLPRAAGGCQCALCRLSFCLCSLSPFSAPPSPLSSPLPPLLLYAFGFHSPHALVWFLDFFLSCHAYAPLSLPAAADSAAAGVTRGSLQVEERVLYMFACANGGREGEKEESGGTGGDAASALPPFGDLSSVFGDVVVGGSAGAGPDGEVGEVAEELGGMELGEEGGERGGQGDGQEERGETGKEEVQGGVTGQGEAVEMCGVGRGEAEGGGGRRGPCAAQAQGSMVGGSMVGGSMVGGSMVGGSMVGGSMVGGSMVGGSMVGGSMVGGSMVGGSMVGGSMPSLVSPLSCPSFALALPGLPSAPILPSCALWLCSLCSAGMLHRFPPPCPGCCRWRIIRLQQLPSQQPPPPPEQTARAAAAAAAAPAAVAASSWGDASSWDACSTATADSWGLTPPPSDASGAPSGVTSTSGSEWGVAAGGEWGTGTGACDSNELGSQVVTPPLASLDALSASLSAAAAKAAAGTAGESNAAGKKDKKAAVGREASAGGAAGAQVACSNLGALRVLPCFYVFSEEEEATGRGRSRAAASAAAVPGSRDGADGVAAMQVEEGVGEGEKWEGEGYEYDQARTVGRPYLRFKKRLDKQPHQCVRYRFNGHPIWPCAPPPLLPDASQACPLCHAPRVFELQLMPPLLFFLLEALRERQEGGGEGGARGYGGRREVGYGEVAEWEWMTVAGFTCSQVRVVAREWWRGSAGVGVVEFEWNEDG
ncbi:unnamed protein product [Closterium sp. Naga37s-1]|nr:unnamed protein product [Closterium sp. Naga37s-1]